MPGIPHVCGPERCAWIPRPYREILDWLTTQNASAQVDNGAALNDLTQIPAATSPAGVRRLVGLVLIATVMSVSLVLLATWV